ncbi:hypothetical protein [Maribacter sp. 2210JD10-5]|uniref:hypothetical protein n=1 Tax=Maribacter sp. 2210JD10-5 TaxID=3386272 RepID=UPI0039BD3265
MKQITITMTVLLVTIIVNLGHGQSKGANELKVGYGALSSIQFLDLANDLTIISGTLGSMSYENKKYGNTIYGSYKHAINDNIMLGGTVAFERVTDNAISGNKKIGERDSKTYTAALEAEYYYISQTFIRLYSGLGAGYSFNKQEFTSTDSTIKNQEEKFNHFNFHVNALGIRVGNALAAFAEVGFGYKGIVNVGLSYQF